LTPVPVRAAPVVVANCSHLTAQPVCGAEVKVTALLLAREDTRDNEPDRDLKIEDFSTRLEAEPSEPVRALARPLT
jgi:hypothetical protein